MPIQASEQPSAVASAARARSGMLLCCERCAAKTCLSFELSSRDEEASRRFVVEMAETTRNALLERIRIVSPGKHLRVVVALEHQRVAARKTRLDMHRADTEVGQDPEAPTTVAADELYRLAGVMRHRERTNLDGVDRERVMGIETVHLGQAGKALGHRRERTEGEPHGGLIARCKCRDPAHVVVVLVGHDDGVDGFRLHADARKPRDSVANTESAVDQQARRARLDQQTVAFAAAAETGEAHAYFN